MERRIRLVWSSKADRSWCTGASLPAQEGASPLVQRTGFLRVQGLMERIRRRRQVERPEAGPRPALPERPGHAAEETRTTECSVPAAGANARGDERPGSGEGTFR